MFKKDKELYYFSPTYLPQELKSDQKVNVILSQNLGIGGELDYSGDKRTLSIVTYPNQSIDVVSTCENAKQKGFTSTLFNVKDSLVCKISNYRQNQSVESEGEYYSLIKNDHFVTLFSSGESPLSENEVEQIIDSFELKKN